MKHKDRGILTSEVGMELWGCNAFGQGGKERGREARNVKGTPGPKLRACFPLDGAAAGSNQPRGRKDVSTRPGPQGELIPLRNLTK